MLDDVAYGAGERLPAGVGLGPVQQQVRRTAGVAQQPDDQPRRVVVLVVVAHEGHRWTAGAVVVELVDVEGGHDAALGEVREVLRRACGRVAGVEEAVEREHHRQRVGAVELGDVVDDVHEPGILGHADRPFVGWSLACSAAAAPPPTLFLAQPRRGG